jgi:proteic killer suppression protein
MDIPFQNTKISKSFNEGSQLEKIHGVPRAKRIRIRMAELRAAENLMVFWPPKSPPSRCGFLPFPNLGRVHSKFLGDFI